MSLPLVWAEIDLRAIAHNTRQLRRITHPEAQLLVAVKANAYGHGAIEIAHVYPEVMNTCFALYESPDFSSAMPVLTAPASDHRHRFVTASAMLFIKNLLQ